MISKDTPSAISSQELVDGQSPSDKRDGQMIDLFGLEAAPVSLSAQQESKKEQKMKDTCGLSGSTSSASADLQRSLESKLQVLLPTDGSMECTLTWKRKVTPSGRLYCQLAPSMRPIKETDCGLWLTPRANEAVEPPGQAAKRLKDRKASTACSLGEQSMSALWATPNTMDHLAQRSFDAMKRQAKNGGRKGRTFPGNLREQVNPEMCQAYNEAILENGGTLHPMALWPTATVRDYKDSGDLSGSMTRKDGKSRLDTIPRLAFGTMPTGSSAQTVKPAASPQLNPEFVSWLMGYSTAHHCSMLSAMQSYRKSPRGSSRRACKEKIK